MRSFVPICEGDGGSVPGSDSLNLGSRPRGGSGRVILSHLDVSTSPSGCLVEVGVPCVPTLFFTGRPTRRFWWRVRSGWEWPFGRSRPESGPDGGSVGWGSVSVYLQLRSGGIEPGSCLSLHSVG